MNSAHDLGGMHGFGPIVREENEPVFHADWERMTFGITFAAFIQGLAGSGDAFRHAIERMGNVRYLTSSYYERWLIAMSNVLVEKGVIGADELTERLDAVRRDPDAFAMPPSGEPDELSRVVSRMFEGGGTPPRESDREPRFREGDQVVTVRRSSSAHTRLPRYARGRVGTVVSHRGPHPFPDTSALGLEEGPEHLYTVRFEASELWGDAADGRGCVHIDLWEPYLLPAGSDL